MTQAATSLRSVAVLTLLTLGQMGLQFAFQILLARQFGARSEMDAFFAALTLPMVISGLLAGSMGSVFVPVYLETKQRSGETAAWTMAVQVTCWMFLVTVLLWQSATYFAEPWMRALHPGFDDEQIWRTEELLRTLSSLMIWNTLGGLARAWNHCLGRFAITGIAAVVGNAVTLGVVCWRAKADGIDAVAQAVSIGAIVTFAMQMPWVSLFSRGWPVTSESQSAVKRCFVLMLPLIIGIACTQCDPLLDQYLVPALPGSLAHLGYAVRLAAAVMTLATSGLAVVAFPALARHAAECDNDKLRAEIAEALRILTLLLVPIVVALVWFSEPLIRDLLQRGRFLATDTRDVAGLLATLCGMIVGGSVGEIAAKVFYSGQNTRTPVIVGLIGFSIGAALKLMWCRPWGLAGLAAATSVYYLFNAVVLLTLIAWRLGWGIFRGWPSTLWRVALGTAAAAKVGSLVLKTALPYSSLCGAVTGGAVFFLVLLLTREEIAWRAVRVIVRPRDSTAVDTEKAGS